MSAGGASPVRSIRSAALFTVGTNALQFGILFVASVIIARLLTPDEFGVFAIAMAANGLVFALQNTGVAQYITNQDSLPPRRLGAILTLQAVQSAAMAVMLVLAAYLLAFFLDDARLVPAMAILAIAALFGPAELVPAGLLQREMRFDALFVIGIAKSVANAGVAVGAASLGYSYASLSIGTVAGAAVGGLLGVLFCLRQLRVPPNLDGWREYWRFGAAMVGIVAVTNLCARAAIVILGRLSDMASVGLFSRATGIVDTVQSGVVEPLVRLVLPTLAAYRRMQGGFGPVYLRAASAITAVSWAAFAGLAVLGKPLIALIYGPVWVPAAPLLFWLCAARVITDLVTCPVEVMVAADRLPVLARALRLRAVVGLVVFSLGATIGLQWAAAARTVEAALGFVLILPLVRAAAGISLGAFLRLWSVSAAAALAASAPGLAWMVLHGWPESLEPPVLALLILGGVLLWLLVLIAFRHELWQQALKLRPRRASRSVGGG